MRIEFLGTAGATTTPRPGCQCRVCVQARQRGVPYSRSGPGIFVHGPDVLIDTSEDIIQQLNRAGITRVAAGLYSHWHPDHTMGRRVWELLNVDFRHWPPTGGTTDVYLPEQVAADFGRWLGLQAHFDFLSQQGYTRVHTIPDGETITLGEVCIRPFRLAASYVYAFIFEERGRRVLIAPDELVGWEPPEFTRGVDLAILPMGVVEHDPLSGGRRIPADHPVLEIEATFAQTLAMLEAIAPERAILTHIEEQDGYSHDDLVEIAAALRAQGRQVEFAYDTLSVDVG
ncbi:MAG TPA: MBL fold metallo-hydrolase [Thermomicrobiales bacterium]|nr:MBL fold metallo-hydrolase [Thermomicrobiales bacterium]